MQNSYIAPALLALLMAISLIACAPAPGPELATGAMPLTGTTATTSQPRLGFSNFNPPAF